MTAPALTLPLAQEVNVEHAVVQFRALADWWANRIQWCEDDHEDLVQEGMLCLVTTLRGYNKSGKEIRDVKAIASVCFSAAMQWWYKKSDRVLHFVGFEGLRIPVDNMEMHFSQIWVDEYLGELEKVHGPKAREIVESLILPDERVAEVALRVMEDKKAQKAEGKRVVGYASPRIQKGHVREAVGLDTKEWDRTMALTKSFTAGFLQREGASAPTALPTRTLTQGAYCTWYPTTDPDVLRYRQELSRRPALVDRFAEEHQCRNRESGNGSSPSPRVKSRGSSASRPPESTMPSSLSV